MAAHLGLQELDQRIEVRKKAADGIWPPPGGKPALKQENKIAGGAVLADQVGALNRSPEPTRSPELVE